MQQYWKEKNIFNKQVMILGDKADLFYNILAKIRPSFMDVIYTRTLFQYI